MAEPDTDPDTDSGVDDAVPPAPDAEDDGSPAPLPVEAVREAVGDLAAAPLEVAEALATGPPPSWSIRLTDRLSGFDDAVDDHFEQRLRGVPTIDRFMYSVTELADFSLLWHLIGATRGLRSEAHAAEAVRLSVVLGVESTVVNGGLKSLFKRTRPVPEHPRPHHLRMPLTTSFPSGHASAAFCAATLLGGGRGPATRAGWLALAGLVASSRVHVKIHHASDVMGGAVVGLALGRLARRLWPRP